jgi:putative tryptophan/tyrosine transport system substrate-binding protein
VRRREFITLLGGAAAWPLAARAQQAAMPVIGFLHQGTPETNKDFIAAFRQGLRQSGYLEGQNVRLEFRWAEARYDRLPVLAHDLVRRPVDVMIAAYLPAALAAKSATDVIPTVFVIGSDPVATGLITSLNRPTGNVTGIMILHATLGAKRLELLHELVPATDVIALLVNPANRNAEIIKKDVQAAALALGQKIHTFNVSNDGDLETFFASPKPGAFLVSPDTFLQSRRHRLIAWATRQGVPAMYYEREYVAAGGLISYGPIEKDSFRLAGIYAARILKGEKPANLPVMQPTKFELVINLAAATALGLDVPTKLLALADEVIE